MNEKPYQSRVGEWLTACFPPGARSDVAERTHRFLKEALELAQASGCTRDHAIALVDYVFGRTVGDLESEAGGVMVTLAALCTATSVSMDDAGERELARNRRRIESIRRKQAAKPSGSPLTQ